MVQDRIISWDPRKRRKRPIAKTLTKTVNSFFRNGKKIEVDPDRLYIAYSDKHWIEVVLDVGTVNVVTRGVDNDTWTTATNLAAHIARTHTGDYSPPKEPNKVRAARENRVETYLEDPEAFYDDPDFD